MSAMPNLPTDRPAKTAAPFLRSNGRAQALPACGSPRPGAPNRLTPDRQTQLADESLKATFPSGLWPIGFPGSNFKLLLLY